MQLMINREQLNLICNQEDVSYLALFGSQARGEAKETSDVDILIDFNHTKSFFQLAHIQEKLEQVFGKKVDLVLRTAIKEQLKPYIAKDLITLYAQN